MSAPLTMRAAIFDLDGTLLDSMYVWHAVGERFFAERGLTLTPETIEGCNLGYQSASEVKDSVRDYIKRLSGTELPDAFFYAV